MASIVVGLFDDFANAQATVQALTDNGFSRDQISVTAGNTSNRLHAAGVETVPASTAAATTAEDTANATIAGAGTGAAIGGALGLLAGLVALTIPGVGPVLVAGPIVSMLGGAALGAAAGGVLGALTEMGVPSEEAGYYAEGVRRGGTLVIVRTEEATSEWAAEIMRQHGVVDINQRAATWRETGWKGYDPNAGPYVAAEMEKDRQEADTETRRAA